MALSVPNYPLRYSTDPAPAAYAWIQALAINFVVNGGNVTVGVNLDVDSANAGLPTIDQFQVGLGQPMGSTGAQGDANVFPTLVEVVTAAATYAAANPTATPFDSIRAVLYTALASHPKLANATPVA